MKIPLIYSLHSGNLYGTERMALSTASGLLADFEPVIMAPPGPALEEARRSGFEAVPFRTAGQFGLALRPLLSRSRRVAFLATGVMHSKVLLAWNRIYRRQVAHLQLVHGGASEKLSYGQKRMLHGHPVQFIAVSSWVRERLIANGVNAGQTGVIENFLTSDRVSGCPRRAPFRNGRIRRLIVISRLDPEKRVDLLLEALAGDSDAGRFEIRIFGTGWNSQELKDRSVKANLNVTFAGFQANVAECLAQSDLLVHMCPVEPFGLAIIEAMAAGIPVIVPDSGGAGSLVEDGVSGFHFRADDAASLRARIRFVAEAGADRLNAVVSEGDRLLDTRFSEKARVEDYRRVLLEKLQ